MKALLTVFLFLVTLSVSANPYCRDFASIKRVISRLDSERIEDLLPHAEWLDEKHKKQDRRRIAGVAGKTIVLLMLKRLTFLSYVFEPTRAGVSSWTGYYVSSPENFVRFLSLEQSSACTFLRMNDSHAEKLRQLTRDVAIELRRSQR